MRMWKVDPKRMCRKHLLGEHVEMHMFVGTINKGCRIDGYISRGLVEVGHIRHRHYELAKEMKARGYKHKSPLPYFKGFEAGNVSILDNERELSRRCQGCQFKKTEESNKPMEGFKMKLNADALKAISEKQIKEYVAILNIESFFQKNPIKGKRHANKADLAQIMVDRVLDAADKGIRIPEQVDILVGKLVDTSDILSPVKIEKKPGKKPSPKAPLKVERAVADAQEEKALTADHKIAKPKKVKEQKEPKGPSNKQIVYGLWKTGKSDVDEMLAATKEAVKKSTIKSWVSDWKRGSNLPKGAK